MTGQRSRVFGNTYQRYLEEIGKIDYLARAEVLGVGLEDNSLVIALFNKLYKFAEGGITAIDGGGLTPAVQVMICKYILTYPYNSLMNLDTRLVTYREFKDSGPLIGYFATNTNKTLESAFSGRLELLRARVLEIGGRVVDSDIYDFSSRFQAFPRIPVFLNFNDKDDTFPAVCSVLYHASAADFLDMECLAMTGTLLTGKLLNSESN